jgi:hypothetical protein
MRVDAAVSAEVMHAISPLAIEAAFQLIGDRERAGAERLRHSELALEQARYEVTHARRQYDAVDPIRAADWSLVELPFWHEYGRVSDL